MPSPFTPQPSDRQHGWLFERYWQFAALVLALSLPLVLSAGSRTDAFALVVFAGISILAWRAAKVNEGVGVRAHLAVLVPFWAWYAELPGGLPTQLDRGPAAHALMLLFPILVFVTLDGVRGAVALGGLTAATFAWRFGLTSDALVGTFLVGLALLIGFTFRRQAEHLRLVNARLARLASHDGVTELPNRRALDAHLSRLTVPMGSLLFVDLSRFKTVTEVFGHASGDELLRLVAQRLGQAVSAEGATAFLAHLGGDQFAVLVERASLEEANAHAERVCEAIHQPFLLERSSVQLGCRVGIAVWPDASGQVGNLFARADRAVASARKQGCRIAVYDSGTDKELDRGVEVEIWQALERGELICHFQPVCELAGGAMVGVEALARWNHPTRGLLGPGAFIELAEQTGQIQQIDRAILEQVAVQLEAWLASGTQLWAAANVSGRTLDDPQFLEFVKDLVDRHPDIRGRLVLEITETAAMRDPERAIALLHSIRDLDLQTALDDFGIGHSSLVYLKRLPADHLKLDRMFVSGIGVSDRDEALLELLLHLAKQFGMDVIAEGVETREQLRWLTERGCGYVQGYLFARPAPAHELASLRARVSGVFGIDAEDASSTQAGSS